MKTDRSRSLCLLHSKIDRKKDTFGGGLLNDKACKLTDLHCWFALGENYFFEIERSCFLDSFALKMSQFWSVCEIDILWCTKM